MNRQWLSEKTESCDSFRMSSYWTFVNVGKEAALWKEDIMPGLYCSVGWNDQKAKPAPSG